MEARKIQTLWIVLMIGIAGCAEGILDPGDVARPLVGTYILESRSYINPDKDSTLILQEPPEVRSYLTLARNGRYGQVDTVETDDGAQVFVETGRWSVLGDQFFIETDANRTSTEGFTYDGIRLTRIQADLFTQQGPLSIIDVWRRR